MSESENESESESENESEHESENESESEIENESESERESEDQSGMESENGSETLQGKVCYISSVLSGEVHTYGSQIAIRYLSLDRHPREREREIDGEVVQHQMQLCIVDKSQDVVMSKLVFCSEDQVN